MSKARFAKAYNGSSAQRFAGFVNIRRPRGNDTDEEIERMKRLDKERSGNCFCGDTGLYRGFMAQTFCKAHKHLAMKSCILRMVLTA